ncbi:MAG TPA: BrnT family toxin [Candidatus Acidoferrales bacterium]|nr:BrnT family toxin [Candidatus Acidoferrales bacterium]
MRFTWDENKSRRNRAKHKISFETAALVFDDPHAISRLERIEDGEERWQTLGLAGGIVILLVVHTYREEGGEEVIRIISARKATPSERKFYEENL